MDINRGIFKALDIRGRVESDLTPDVARLLGRGIGTCLQRRGHATIVVGRDNRVSSPGLAGELMHGLAASGCTVIDIGQVPTPALYHAAVTRGNTGGVMVTASHLGPQYNGFKVCLGARTLMGADLTEIRDLILANDLVPGAGRLEEDTAAGGAYVERLAQLPRPARPLKVVLDAGNGMAGALAPGLFTAQGHQVTPLFCESDGTYPNHVPDPQSAKNLADLMAEVRRQQARLGLAYDGDADRVGVVDETGTLVTADRIAVLLSVDILSRHPGAKIVVDVLCSQVLVDAISEHGGRPIMWKSGHSFIKDKLFETGAAFGVEMSGHMFFADDYYGYDDGIYASLRIAKLVADAGRPLSELMASVPTLYSTPEYRPRCSGIDRFAVVREVSENLARRFPVIDVDGVRIVFEHGWGLLRASNTEEVLSLRFEGATAADVAEYCDVFRQQLRRYSQVAEF